MSNGYAIETVNLAAEARAQIKAAREQGVDPWDLYRGHLGIAREMKLALEAMEGEGDDQN